MSIDYRELSEIAGMDMAETMKRYFEHGIRPGSFTSAVLQNDLKTACQHADTMNRHRLHAIVMWLVHEAPPDAWGSREQFERHLASRSV